MRHLDEASRSRRQRSSGRRQLTTHNPSNYSYYMKSIELKVSRIGNSRGVRIPATTLQRYHIVERVVMEERSDGILLRPVGTSASKLSWEETAREMAAAAEDWSAWDETSADGLETAPWAAQVRSRRVAEPKAEYPKGHRQRKR